MLGLPGPDYANSRTYKCGFTARTPLQTSALHPARCNISIIIIVCGFDRLTSLPHYTPAPLSRAGEEGRTRCVMSYLCCINHKSLWL